MFALISDDVLYFKVDQSNRDKYEETESKPFQHGISYWEVPVEVLEDSSSIQEWAEMSIKIALELAKRKGKQRKR